MSSVAGPAELERLSAEQVVAELGARFGPRLAVACSFQKEATVILDLVVRHAPQALVFTLDTGVLFPETYATWQRVQEHYGIEIAVFEGPSLARQASLHGERLWERDPDRCCELRKVRPLTRALAGAEAWVSGLRREQSPARAHTPKLAWDETHQRWKASPLADWGERDVWRYIAEHDLPYHPLHDAGYASIGCVHCTRPGSGREGRWAGSEKDECGLHA